MTKTKVEGYKENIGLSGKKIGFILLIRGSKTPKRIRRLNLILLKLFILNKLLDTLNNNKRKEKELVRRMKDLFLYLSFTSLLNLTLIIV